MLIEIREIIDLLERFDAIDTQIFDMRTTNAIVDFFVIASAVSKHQLQSFQVALKNSDIFDFYPQISTMPEWIIADFRSQIMVHFVSKGVREYYNFDDLWKSMGANIVSAKNN